ncbi:MAG TPA: FKBP-type peptidyl-prolyl cis-trans isomerase [Rhizomicrobium sp.]|jgi:FKBP-type peptidyl-prolyl cis-trans isomerase|nr:FKBP-type peptidyl-prolyl cis-trans isomerase [Rhizomicrobium sp.]
MRIPTAMAAILFGAFALAGCGDKAGAPTYDLTPESNQKFLADNGARKDVVTTASGLQYRIINSGHGKGVTAPTDIVTVTYKGWTIDGHVFDRTQHGQTASFPAGGLIPGWVEALKLMHAGDEWQLVIPADLGYGAEGAGADIPPNQTLVFNMQLISVHAPDQ